MTNNWDNTIARNLEVTQHTWSVNEEIGILLLEVHMSDQRNQKDKMEITNSKENSYMGTSFLLEMNEGGWKTI